MKLFFGNIEKDKTILSVEESHHLSKVLRLSVGDTLEVTDGKGKMIRGRIIKLGKNVETSIEELLTEPSVLKNKLHIAIAPTKNIDRFEFFMEKATELGVSEITPLLTHHSERKLINHEKLKKQLIVYSKQCLRATFPILNPLTKLDDFLKQHSDYSNQWVAHCYKEFKKENLSNFQGDTIVFIGPEGDFSPAEIEKMNNLGIKGLHLGNARLRTETAGILVASKNYLQG